MCVAEKLFKMPPILRWSSFVPLADAAASSTSLQKLNIPKKKIYKTKKCQLWNPSRDCLSLARAFHLLFLPLGNKMTLLPKQQKHWVVVDVDHSKNKRGCVFPRIENFSSSMTSLRDGYPER